MLSAGVTTTVGYGILVPGQGGRRGSGMATPRQVLASKQKPPHEIVAISVVIVVPFLAVLLAVPVAWGWGITWDVVALGVTLYVVSMLGVSAGFHRLFTHRSFQAPRAVRIGLALAGSLAVQGPLIRWVADHRRHHAFTDRDGDPHSPWRYGTSFRALTKGMVYAHLGWFYDREETNQEVFAADLLADRDLRKISRLSGLLAAVSVALPGIVELAVGASPGHVLSALFWAGLVRIFLVHHVSWSVNSICHTVGHRPFRTRDRSANFWPLALLSMGDAWHNSHHAMPSFARHGVMRGQVDISAWFIAALERLGLASGVKWPTQRALRHYTRDQRARPGFAGGGAPAP